MATASSRISFLGFLGVLSFPIGLYVWSQLLVLMESTERWFTDCALYASIFQTVRKALALMEEVRTGTATGRDPRPALEGRPPGFPIQLGVRPLRNRTSVLQLGCQGLKLAGRSRCWYQE